MSAQPFTNRRARGARQEYLPEGEDRIPPADPAAELGVLGCVFLAPSTCLDELLARGFAAEWFDSAVNQVVFRTCADLHRAKVPLDFISLAAALKKTGELASVNIPQFMAGAMEQTPSAGNLEYYASLVREKWQLRALLRTCAEVQSEVHAGNGSVDELLARAQKMFLELERSASPALERLIKQVLLDDVVPELEGHYSRGRAQVQGLTTGLEYVDKILCGLGGKHGNYVVIAARPNVGKTSLATQIAMHAALDHVHWQEVATDYVPAEGESVSEPNDQGKRFKRLVGMPVGISSLEMGAAALVQKKLFQRSKADLQRWRTGFAENGDLVLLVNAAGQLAQANNIIIDDTPRLKIGQLKARWRRWYRQYGVRLFILDYLQLMQADNRSGRGSRVDELAEVSAELQALGKELNCPMIVLAQMNRDYEKDPNRAPRMSDLKDCGAVEQDADVIGFLYAPRMSDTTRDFFENAMRAKFGDKWNKWDGRPERINLLVGKNRFGPKGKAELLLLHSSTTFVDWNVWLKENKLMAAAKGESQYRERDEEDEL